MDETTEERTCESGPRLQAEPFLAGGQAGCDDGRSFLRQDTFDCFGAQDGRRGLRRLVEISQFAFAGEFENRVGIELGEGGQFLNFGLGALTLDGQGEQRAGGH